MQSYERIAADIDERLKVYLDKGKTTIHIDGHPSEQKSRERYTRQAQLNCELEKLKVKVQKRFAEGKRASPARFYRKCRDLYRPNPPAIREIITGLKTLGWSVCNCPFQADTHIGELCRHEPDKMNLAVISGDSDLLVFEGVPSITMPVGKPQVWTTFSKADVLVALDLPSDRHFQLAAMLTKNDYFEGIRSYGIARNAELVRQISFEHGQQQASAQGRADKELVSMFHKAIEDYLALIETAEGKTLADYHNAITAFVLCQENWSESATPSAQTETEVCIILRQLEDNKLRRRGLLPVAQAQTTIVGSPAASESVVVTQSQVINNDPQQQSPPRSRREMKKEMKKEKKKMKKLETWRKARYDIQKCG